MQHVGIGRSSYSKGPIPNICLVTYMVICSLVVWLNFAEDVSPAWACLACAQHYIIRYSQTLLLQLLPHFVFFLALHNFN